MTARSGWLWLGRRGWVLLLMGLIWLIQAWAVYQLPYPDWRPRALHEYLPPVIREALWVITGITAIWSAFLRRPGADRWGFAALLIMPAERAASWAGSAIIGIGGWMDMPDTRLCIANTAVQLVTVVLLLIIAGWREAPMVIKVRQQARP